MITPECTWGVTRQGEFRPCEKPAVARMYDPESAEVWSVCAYHTRKDALPMDVWLASEVLKAKADAWDEGQKSGLRYADRAIKAHGIGRPDLPGPPTHNPYRTERTTDEH